MVTSNETILVVAAEAREFAGLLKRTGQGTLVAIPEAAFAREIFLHGHRTVLLANGPGPRLVKQMLASSVFKEWRIEQIISTGFCGALDPSLRIGDIVKAGEDEIWSEDRVAVRAEDKRRLRETTGKRVVDMEYAAVRAKAAEWGVPCRAIRVVSDSAAEDLPLDFNRYRDAQGRFQLTRIALAGIMRPFSVLPKLIQLDRNSKLAAENLGAFFVDSKF
jgi:adenosylhomocysteine nucleosidase